MRYAVTGASGWLGAAAVALLQRRGEDVIGFASRSRHGLSALSDLPTTPHDVLLHFAFVTREFVAERGLDAYLAANLGITATVLAAVRRYAPAVAYASSGAVHLGDELRANPYGVAKRIDEDALRGATAARCSIQRVYNVAGPYVRKPESFALTDLLSQSLRGADELVVRAGHRVVRSFVDVEDVAAMAIATAGQDLVLETAGAEEIELAELARRVDPSLPLRRPPAVPGSGEDRYVGDSAGYAAACAAASVELKDLDTQIIRTRDSLRSTAQHQT